MRFCLRALASATFLMGRASMAFRRAFSSCTSSWLIAGGGLHHHTHTLTASPRSCGDQWINQSTDAANNLVTSHNSTQEIADAKQLLMPWTTVALSGENLNLCCACSKNTDNDGLATDTQVRFLEIPTSCAVLHLLRTTEACHFHGRRIGGMPHP